MMQARRRISFRDLPLICLADGLIWALAAVALLVAARQNLVTEAQLTPVTGTIQNIRWTAGKGGAHLDLDVSASGGILKLTQGDMSNEFPALRQLRVGDAIAARVRHSTLGDDRYWELRRNGTMILTYEQMNQYFIEASARTAVLSHWFMVLSTFFVICAALLRIVFGAWMGRQTASDTQPPAPSPV